MLCLNSNILFFLFSLQGSRLIAKSPYKFCYRSACDSALEASGVEKWGCAHSSVFLTFLTAKGIYGEDGGIGERVESGKTF